MKSIMSINYKFFDYSPKEIYEIICDYDVDGFEIFIDFYNKFERDYLLELAYFCSKNNLHFQVHGSSALSIDDQKEFFNLLYQAYDMLGYQINLVLHSVSAQNVNESILKTTDYLNQLTDIIQDKKIRLTLENLNDDLLDDRLNKFDITPIIANNEKIFMTYDIGHEIAEYGKITNLNENIIPLIKNVHIHSVNKIYSEGYDHKPIVKNDDHWLDLIKGILFLKVNNYDGPIVFEYDVNACIGNTLKERIISYAESMKFFSERFK